MIECRLGEDTENGYVRFKGDLPVLIADLGALINSIYNALRDHDPEAAELFADNFQRVLKELKDQIFGPAIVEGVAIGTVTKKRKEEAADD